MASHFGFGYVLWRTNEGVGGGEGGMRESGRGGGGDEGEWEGG